jgi:hypothetical protein
MKVGDLVNYIPYADKNYGIGIITSIDDFSRRQTVMYVLFSKGIVGPIWEKYLEVINESR